MISFKYTEANVSEEILLKLNELYKSLHSSYEFLLTFYDIDDLHAFTIYKNEIIKHILVFKILADKSIVVVNKMITIENEYIKLFCDFIFKNFTLAPYISFNGLLNVNDDVLKLLPKATINTYLDDFVISLPKTIDEYKKLMGKKTRSHTSNYISKLNRNFSKVEFRILEKKELTDDIVSKIVKLNHMRMEKKGLPSLIDSEYESKLKNLTPNLGQAGLLMLDEKIVASALCFKLIDNYFLQILSNDPEYDNFNVGHTALFLMIKNCIEGNGKTLHLLWGEFDYKKRFLGEKQQSFCLKVNSNLL